MLLVYIMSVVGLDLLDMARRVAALDMPGTLIRLVLPQPRLPSRPVGEDGEDERSEIRVG